MFCKGKKKKSRKCWNKQAPRGLCFVCWKIADTCVCVIKLALRHSEERSYMIKSVLIWLLQTHVQSL